MPVDSPEKSHAPETLAGAGKKTGSSVGKAAISIALAAALLYFFLRNLDLAKVGSVLRNANGGWIALSVFLSVAMVPIRAWRWTRLLRRIGAVSQLEASSATAIGFAATTLLPARLGEIVRPVVLARRTRLPVTPLLASIALERLLDLVTVLVLFAVYALGWVPTGLTGDEARYLGLLRRSALVMGAIALSGLVVLGFLAARPALADRVLARVFSPLPDRFATKLASLVRSFLEGLSGIRTPADVAVIAGSSLFLWLFISCQMVATFRAFDLGFAFPVAFFVITWAVIGLAIPTPGGVGGYHAAVSYALTGFYGVATNTAAAFAIAAHVISFVPITIIGVLLLATGGMSLKGLASTD